MKDSNSLPGTYFAVGVAWLCFLAGCGKFDPDRFLRQYREDLEVVTIRNGIRVSTLAMSPDYMTAMRLRGGSGFSRKAVDSLGESFSHSILVRLSISYQGLDSAGKEGDILNSAISNGRHYFSRQLELYQSGMREKCVLEYGNGKALFPSTYALERNWGLSDETTFIFAFPKSAGKEELSDGGATLLITEFGLALGNIRHPINLSRALRLRI